MAKDNSILAQIKSYCAYQERSHKEVRSKLLSLHVYGDELEECISVLIEENFLNEERYACAIARGKFRFKQWGRHKILYALKQQQISAYCIQLAMKEIDEDEYIATFEKLVAQKLTSLISEKNKFSKMTKLRAYLLQKGYEMEYINEAIHSHLN